VDFALDPSQTVMNKIYGSCDVWMVGSRSEGFGLLPLEAMACRTPVVATDVGAAPQIINEGINGHLTPIEHPKLMAARAAEILRLADAEWLMMSRAAFESSHSYTWDDATDRLEQVLADLITG